MLEAIFESSIDLTLYLQSLDWLISPMEFFTFLGTEDFYSLVMPVLIWSIDYGLGMRVGIILLSGNSLNAILKWVFLQPRPYWYDGRVSGLVSEHSLGVPSGHSQNPASIYGLIAVSLKRRWVWVIALMLIFLIGLSRITLGAHFTLDVVVGWTVGFLFLWLFLRLEEKVTAWLKSLNFSKQIGSVFLFSIGLILIGFLVLGATSGFQVPSVWETNAGSELDPFNPNGLISSAASLFGLGAGALWLGKRGGFSAKGEIWKRAVRFVIGVIVTLAILEGLGSIFPRNPDLLSYGLRYLRYGLMGFWVSGLAPVVFKRAGLAEGA
jgi:membrane-associated phospholipid phosphatase